MRVRNFTCRSTATDTGDKHDKRASIQHFVDLLSVNINEAMKQNIHVS